MSPHPKYKPTLSRLKRLHPSAEVLGQVARMMRDSKQEIESIAETLRTDASLSSDIIRMSNSSYYGFASQIGSLDEALQRIGLREAQKLVNLSLARSVYSKSLRHYQLSAATFWTRGVSCALLMERLAHIQGLHLGDAYTAGTLHLAGKVVIDELMSACANNTIWNKQDDEIAWEREQTGVDYALAGSDLVTLWRMPEDIAEAIAGHLEPAGDAQAMTLALNLATTLIAQCGCELKESATSLPPSAKALGLDLAGIVELQEDCHEQLLTIKDSLGIQGN